MKTPTVRGNLGDFRQNRAIKGQDSIVILQEKEKNKKEKKKKSGSVPFLLLGCQTMRTSIIPKESNFEIASIQESPPSPLARRIEPPFSVWCFAQIQSKGASQVSPREV